MPEPFKSVSVRSLPEDQRTCTICQGSLGGSEGGVPVKTQCNHIFDRNCIVRWLDEGNSNCPVCHEEVHPVGGSGLRDRLRGIRESFRRARERDAEDREQTQQAQADSGGASNLDDTPRSFSNPSRDHDSQSLATGRTIPSSMQRAQSNYRSALSYIEYVDERLFRQAQASHRASQAQHQGERKIQEAFARFLAAQESNDRREIENAILIQDTATLLLDGATSALELEDSLLANLMKVREQMAEELKEAREDFTLESEMFTLEVEVSLDGSRY
ncbi:hypothetical protein DSL72_006685 [Monilinia vaccinii-corymbosi]|uniref:RING-type domain-containing protein n=1 Tax=Monilinia vaccinii-corymbosi TaxID=61207 RepID=A0A8A3PMV3_9HELO|nr:hypothetical protein DSL72_006685 [Monilinia vaccinii-corymbosi]